jgi:hypothetical protein
MKNSTTSHPRSPFLSFVYAVFSWFHTHHYNLNGRKHKNETSNKLLTYLWTEDPTELFPQLFLFLLLILSKEILRLKL